MEFYGYPDCAVFDEVVSGVGLAGPAPVVESFDPCFKPAKMTVAELSAQAHQSRQVMLASVRSSGDAEIDRTVFDKTQEELDCGWLSGPYNLADLPLDAVVSRRFGIRQSSGDTAKIRLIDDFSASMVNDTVQVESAPKLHTLDVVAGLCAILLRSAGEDEWLGKTIDLSAAYRQLAISPDFFSVSFIAVFDPSTGKPRIYSMRALPFGASRSVYGFLRVAHSLWWLGCRALKFAWSNFFDDFVTFARAAEASSVTIASLQFFKLLGWAVATGEKDLPFCSSFKALGVELDLSSWTSGKVFFANTEKRTQELLSSTGEVLDTGKLGLQKALVLRGRMQFAKAQLWGRAARLCLNAVTNHAYQSDGDVLSEYTLACLKAFVSYLNTAKPREISCSWSSPYFLFTDACFAPDDLDWPCGLGGVLVNPAGRYASAFSFCLSVSDLSKLGYPDKKTIIFEAELLAVIVSFFLWQRILKGRPCVVYVDNNGTRDVCISGSARTSPGKELVAKLLMVEDSVGVVSWFARVSSSSNVADGPSRGSCDGVEAKFLSPLLVGLAVSKCLEHLVQTNG